MIRPKQIQQTENQRKVKSHQLVMIGGFFYIMRFGDSGIGYLDIIPSYCILKAKNMTRKGCGTTEDKQIVLPTGTDRKAQGLHPNQPKTGGFL